MPPPAKPKPNQKLELTTNSLRNTTMSVDDDTMFYEIVTRFWHPHLTKINRTNMETREVFTAAEIEREPGKDARVRFGGESGEWMSATEFMTYDPDAPGGTFGSAEAKFRWVTHKGRFQLVRADDEDDTPIASFHPHKRHFFVFRMSKHAYIEIKPVPEVTSALERLIVSYLLVERRRRDSKTRIKFEKS